MRLAYQLETEVEESEFTLELLSVDHVVPNQCHCGFIYFCPLCFYVILFWYIKF